MAGFRGGSRVGPLARRECGIALVIVLWMVVMFTVIAGSFAFAMRQETVLTGNQLSLAQAEAFADAGVYRAIYELGTPKLDGQEWKADGTPREFDLGGGRIRVVATDESAKIDLNTAPDAILGGLLTVVGVADEEKPKILDAILDWRDPDNIKHANGAEADDYKAAGLGYVPSNRPFESVRELSQVLGVTPSVYRRMAPHLTVYSGSAINPALASREVLLSVPGVNPSVVESFIVQRDQSRLTGTQPPPFPDSSPFLGSISSQVVSVRAEARLANGVIFIRDAISRLTGDTSRPVAFLVWKEGEAVVAKGSETMGEANVK